MLYIVMLLLTILYCPMHAMDSKPLPQDQAAALVSKNIVEVLHAMKQFDLRVPGNFSLSKTTVKLDWLPGYIIKHDPQSRIAGAAHLEPCIKQEGLSLLRMPNMVKVPVAPRHELLPKLSADFAKMAIPSELCLSEYMQGSPCGTFNLQQAKQMIILLTKATKIFADCNGRNIIWMPNGDLGLIDTELRGLKDNTPENIEWTLSFFYTNNTFDAEAKDYFKNEFFKRYNRNLE